MLLGLADLLGVLTVFGVPVDQDTSILVFDLALLAFAVAILIANALQHERRLAVAGPSAVRPGTLGARVAVRVTGLLLAAVLPIVALFVVADLVSASADGASAPQPAPLAPSP